ncbi:MAG: putative 4-hydroxybenzoate polyprenyltransferase [Planctomycetaceae bacterium]|jgi:4-hydroxybenzoate polyprenyltransferase|nr:putative 4-hydroxybenzoate polyprenyltransferase [Planctomycetaceae bacterium]
MNLLKKLLGLIRFSHTLFALPFAILGAAMALKLNWYENELYRPRIMEWVGILFCMVFARSAAMGFNRWADQELDAQNPRTANRHLPAGLLTAQSVLFFVAVCSVGFIASTLLFLPNRIPFFASIPVLLFLFCYSFAKRWTMTAHFWLGGALMLAPLAAWFVVRPILLPIPLPPILLALAVLFWTAGFDLIYATQDTEFDKKTGLFSVPGKYGNKTAFRLSAICHVVSILCFATIPYVYEPFGLVFQFGVGVIALILAAEHWVAAPKPNKPVDLLRVNVAFFQMNVFVSVSLLLIGLFDLFTQH